MAVVAIVKVNKVLALLFSALEDFSEALLRTFGTHGFGGGGGPMSPPLMSCPHSLLGLPLAADHADADGAAQDADGQD